MNKKTLSIIVGIVLLMLIVYLIFNPTWITKPKYMLDKQYCEQDSDCIIQTNNCDPVNIYNLKNSWGLACQIDTCGAKCNENTCKRIAECK